MFTIEDIKEQRIVFMGTPEIAASTLESLINDGFNIVAVIAQEDKPVGRKGILMPVPTKAVALNHNIPVFQPHRIRKEYEFVNDLKPDLILTIAYGQIIPQALLDIPRLGCLNLHGSILPYLRGAAPIQRSIMNGDKVTGITLTHMTAAMDAGVIYKVEEVQIDDNDNYTSLCKKMALAAGKICRDWLPAYFEGKLTGVPQEEDKVTIASKILPEEEKLDLSFDCNKFINTLRGLSYEPGGYIIVDNKKMKIFKAHRVNDSLGDVGKIEITKTITLQLKDGVIMLDEVQLEGKKQMDGKSFANGNKAFNGIVAK